MTDAADRPKGRSVRPLAALLPFFRPYRGTLVLATLALVIAAGAMLALPVAARYVIDRGFAANDAATINLYFGWFLLAAVVFGVFAAIRFYFVTWLGERVVADIRDAVYRQVVRLDATFFEVTRTGEVLSRLTTDTTLVQSLAGSGISIALRSPRASSVDRPEDDVLRADDRHDRRSCARATSRRARRGARSRASAA